MLLTLASLTTFATVLIALLFLAVMALLAYGFVSFGRAQAAGSMAKAGERVFDMRREVLWTAIASILLLIIFFAVR